MDTLRTTGLSGLSAALFRGLASYALSCALFFFLFVLTLLGTLEQIDRGLYATQQKYFESLWTLHSVGPIPVPLPGGRLILGLLFVNLLLGAVAHIRRDWRRIGILMAHAGILLLLAGVFVAYRYSVDGRMVLYEGQQSDFFESDRDWELVVAELRPDGTRLERVVPAARLEATRDGRPVVLAPDGLPFEVEVAGYGASVVPQPAAADSPPRARTVDGFYLQAQGQSDAGAPGAFVTLRDAGTGERREGIVWGRATAPWRVQAGGREGAVDLRRVRRPMPFAIELDRFHRELHPRTDLPKSFESEIVKVDGATRRPARITMNEPLRYKGFTVYQASWGPQDAPPGAPLFSVLAVARNPAERVPLYACLIIACGLTLHFTIRLLRHLKVQGSKTP